MTGKKQPHLRPAFACGRHHAPRELPYEGAKKMLLVENVDDRDFLRELVPAMCEELPEPKAKKGKI